MEILEQQNNELTDTLDERIGALKGLTIELGDEAREHNRLLDEIELDFSSADSLLKGTMQKLSVLINTGGNKHMCYLALFALGVFLFLYFVISWGS